MIVSLFGNKSNKVTGGIGMKQYQVEYKLSESVFTGIVDCRSWKGLISKLTLVGIDLETITSIVLLPLEIEDKPELPNPYLIGFCLKMENQLKK